MKTENALPVQRMMRDRFRRAPTRVVAFGLALVLASSTAEARESVSVAAAANLTYVVGALDAELARSDADVAVAVTLGASGTLYAQIVHGAPFDLFLSADTDYPHKLIDAHAGDAGSFIVFATGRLAFWTTRRGVDVNDVTETVRSTHVAKIALAQPKTAPYGRAAELALRKLQVWDFAKPKLVYGENIAQTAQFVETGNADCGFVALSLLKAGSLQGIGRWSEIPSELHDAAVLDHAAVLTTRGAANPAARRYLAFLRSAAAKHILEQYGYRVP